jgi:hypothetical protein
MEESNFRMNKIKKKFGRHFASKDDEKGHLFKKELSCSMFTFIKFMIIYCIMDHGIFKRPFTLNIRLRLVMRV